MNILIVVAHPVKDSFSFAMANKYKTLAESKNHSAEIIDLYRCEQQQEFYTFEKVHEIEKTKEMEFFQSKISNADEIVFVFPYWWGSMPAILKNFIDWNFAKGFAFTYKNSRPIGLLTGKSVSIMTSTGAPKFFYNITGANRRLKNMFKQQIINFCGMKLKSCIIIGGVDQSKTDMKDQLSKIRFS